MGNPPPAEGFPPGEFILDFLEGRGWTQVDLADVLGWPVQRVNQLVQGKRGISVDTAKGLASAFGTTAELWLNLNSAWQLYLAQGPKDDAVPIRAELYTKAPIREMIRRHWIEPSNNPEVLEQRLLEFFGTRELDQPPFPHAARMGAPDYTSAHTAWLCRVRQLGRTIPAEPYSARSMKRLLADLHALTESPDEARHIPRVLANAGVRLLIVEHLPRTKIDGACLWLDDRSPVVALSLRFDRIDNFWHTLMHELAHVARKDGRRGGPVIDEDLFSQHENGRSDAEQEADRLAATSLIPAESLNDFIVRQRPLFSKVAIRRFAKVVRVHPGIVVGQLQHRGAIGWSHSRDMLKKVRAIIIQAALTDGWGQQVSTGLQTKEG